MKRIFLTSLWVVISFNVLAGTEKIDTQKVQRMAPVLTLLSQPIDKQQRCAKRGYIGYQNALSATYMQSSIHGNKDNIIKAYAWSLVAYHQIKQVDDAKLRSGQQKTLEFVSAKMSPAEIQKANRLANDIIKKYGNSWPAPAKVLQMKNFPSPCTIHLKKELK